MCVGVLSEDVEDQSDPIDDVALERLLKIALLSGREIVVEHDDVDVEHVRLPDQFGEFALPYERCGIGSTASNEHSFNRIRARRVGEQFEFAEAPVSLCHTTTVTDQSDEERPLPYDVEVGDGRGKASPAASDVGFRVIGHERSMAYS